MVSAIVEIADSIFPTRSAIVVIIGSNADLILSTVSLMRDTTKSSPLKKSSWIVVMIPSIVVTIGANADFILSTVSLKKDTILSRPSKIRVCIFATISSALVTRPDIVSPILGMTALTLSAIASQPLKNRSRIFVVISSTLSTNLGSRSWMLVIASLILSLTVSNAIKNFSRIFVATSSALSTSLGNISCMLVIASPILSLIVANESTKTSLTPERTSLVNALNSLSLFDAVSIASAIREVIIDFTLSRLEEISLCISENVSPADSLRSPNFLIPSDTAEEIPSVITSPMVENIVSILDLKSLNRSIQLPTASLIVCLMAPVMVLIFSPRFSNQSITNMIASINPTIASTDLSI